MLRTATPEITATTATTTNSWSILKPLWSNVRLRVNDFIFSSGCIFSRLTAGGWASKSGRRKGNIRAKCTCSLTTGVFGDDASRLTRRLVTESNDKRKAVSHFRWYQNREQVATGSIKVVVDHST